LETREGLEQLRALENGYGIHVSETDYSTIGVDTPEELAAVEAILASTHSAG
jgi:3-deoxy-manno-octulosonate cytidylyltransferase (CMP-KDO synthetase)